MSAHWLLLAAFAAVGYLGRCDSHSPGPDQKAEGGLFVDTVFGFKPCLDKNCGGYGPDVLKPTPEPENGRIENPKVHCIFLRPSAIKMFEGIESMHPDILDVKYRILEELIDHMHSFASLEMENCQPEMKLIDLVILAGNSLKTQYQLQGGEDCIYKSSHEQDAESDQSYEKTESPCIPVSTESSEYSTDVSKVCPGSTMEPEVTSKPTEKPHVPSYPKHPTTEKPHVPSYTKHPTTEKPHVPSYPKNPTTEKPYVPSSTKQPTSEEPCPDEAEEIEIIAEDELEAEIPQVGSMRGVPGVHYPNYKDIPITSFTCADKKYIPGFYADLETGCQVFHVCYEHRRESFLCPIGTIFNQPILACDFWYSSNCSLASHYYNVNEKTEFKEEKIDEEVEELLTLIVEGEKSVEDKVNAETDLEKISPFFPVKVVVTDTSPELEVSAKPVIAEAEVVSEIVHHTVATKVISGTKHIKSIPEQKPVHTDFTPVLKQKAMRIEDLLKSAVIPLAKAKLAAVPISKLTALKTTVPFAGIAAKVKVAVPVAAAKAKLAALPAAKLAVAAPVLTKAKMIAATVPVVKVAAAAPVLTKAKMIAATVPVVKVAAAAPVLAKTKLAIPAAKVAVVGSVAAKTKIAVATPLIAKGKFAVPAVKMVTAKVAAKSIPALKAKMVASAVPLAKSKIVPLMKAKIAKSAGVPLLKTKMLALPLAKSKLAGSIPLSKVKLAKAVAISPLTKKALALGYMKLLKAKKLALMG